MPEQGYIEQLVYISNNVVAFGIGFLVQSTILIVLGFGLAYVFRKRGAVIQSLILRAFLVAVLIAPFVTGYLHSVGLTRFMLDIPAASIGKRGTGESPVRGPAVPPEGYDAERREYQVSAVVSGEAVAEGYNAIRSDGPVIFTLIRRYEYIAQRLGLNARSIAYIGFAAIWLFLSMFYLARFAIYSVRVLYIRCTAYDVDSDVLKLAKATARRMGVDQPLISESSLVRSPFLTGPVKPSIFLPEGIQTTAEIFIHELAHLVRHDNHWNLLGQFAKMLFPIQPLMRIFVRRIEFVEDCVCDDYVITYSYNPRAYAHQLYSLAEWFRPVEFEAMIGVGIIPLKSTLRRRVERILDSSGRVFIAARTRAVVLVILFCLASTVLTGFIDYRGASSPENSKSLTMALSPEYAVVPVSLKILLGDSRMTPPNRQIPAVEIPKPETEPAVDSNGASQDILTEETLKRTDETATAVSFDRESTESWGIRLKPARHKEAYNPIVGAVPMAKKIKVAFDAIDESVNIANYTVEDVAEYYESDEYYINPETIQDIETCKIIGMKLLDLGRWADAERVLLRGMEFDPNDAEIRNYLGLTYRNQRKNDLAILYFKLAVKLEPDYAQAYYNLGVSVLMQGKAAEAWEYFKVAVKLNPAYARERGKFIMRS